MSVKNLKEMQPTIAELNLGQSWRSQTDGQTYRREVHCANSVLTLHCGVHHMNMDTIGGPPSEMMRGTLRGSTDKTLWLF